MTLPELTTALPELKLPDTSVCPRCGAGLRCGMVAGDTQCWCVQLSQVMPVPRAKSPHPNPPPAGEGTDPAAASCFCPACLKQITDASIHASAGANLQELASLPEKFPRPS